MMRLLICLHLTLWSAMAALAQSQATIDLGPSRDVAALYSFPNCVEVCGFEQSLTQTIERYLRDSLRRDGFNDTAVSAFETTGGRISVQLTGSGAVPYATALPAFLNVGWQALQTARGLPFAVDSEGHRIWRYHWRFFLPHGVAMVNHRTVQLLHFPPDSVLLDKQNYLQANTTDRWAHLLVQNGAASRETDGYQNIIDVLPISAPDSDKRNVFDPVYPYFDRYVLDLLNLWLPRGTGVRPLVVFGGPARQRLKAVTGVDLPGVLELRKVTLASGAQVSALSANHPSRIWHARDPDVPPEQQLGAAMGMMKDDLIAACWQVRMATDASAVPESTLASCKQGWAGRETQICELSQIQVFNKTPAQAHDLCAATTPDALRATVERIDLGVVPDKY